MGRLAGIGVAAVAVASAVASALGYLVPVLGARTLPAADLGALATVLAIAGIVAVPSMGLQIAVAVRRAKQPGASAARAGWLTAVVCTVTVAVTAPIAGPSLDLPVTVILLLAVYTGAIVLAGRWLGELQGDERFLPLAAGMAVQAVGRYGGLSAGLLLNAGLTGSMLIGTASALLIPAALAWLARPENGNAADPTRPEDGSATGLARPESGSATGLARSESGSASGPAGSESGSASGLVITPRQVFTACSAALAMLVVSYADLLLARALLPAAASGAYAVGTVLTKGAIWAPQVVSVLALPRLAHGSRRALLIAIGLVTASGTILVTASALAGGLAFGAAGGPGYVHLGRYAPVFAATGALYALVYVLINAQVAAGAKWPSAPLWAGTGVLVLATLIVPHTFVAIMWAALGTAVLILATLTIRNIRLAS